MLVREAHFFLLKKQLVSIFVVPSSSKFQIRDHARLLKQELQSSSTCNMFGWSNELIRWHITCIVLEIDSKATRQSKLGAVYFLHYPPGPPWPCHYLSTLVYVYNKKSTYMILHCKEDPPSLLILVSH